MARFLKTRKEEIGLSPYALHFRGEKKSDNIFLRVIDYDAENLEEIDLNSVDEVLKFHNSNTTSWFNLDGLHDQNIMEKISTVFDFDPRIMADAMDTHARPRIHEYDDCIYISIKMLQYDEVKNYISGENLVIIIKEKIVITFQEKPGDVFDPLRERIRKNKKRLRTSSTDYLAFAIMDIVFDNYKYIISELGSKIESLEVDLLNNPHSSILESINSFKKEFIYLNKSIKPCRELSDDLYKLDSDLLSDEVSVHLKELKDNINQSIESLESYREILSDQLNMYHTTMSTKLNDIMKFLTVFSVIFIPLTFIAGVYGTNFDFIPELHFKYSYFIMWAIMIIITVFMIFYFKKKKWF